MNCYLCDSVLQVSSNIDFPEHDIYNIITFLDCPKCKASVEFYHPKHHADSASVQCSIR